jgi:hypothetical protein
MVGCELIDWIAVLGFSLKNKNKNSLTSYIIRFSRDELFFLIKSTFWGKTFSMKKGEI